MKLEDQVCSLELAKKLKELGVEQKSLFVWEYYNDTCYAVKFFPFAIVINDFTQAELYSAFTVAELGEMLPDYIKRTGSQSNDQPIISQKSSFNSINYYYIFGEYKNGGMYPIFSDINEANARAKMLIYLLENELVIKE